MSKTLNRRLGALERCQRTPGGPCCFESDEAARAAGFTGGFIVIGATMPTDEWCAAAKQQQADLMKGFFDAAT